jgi:hypothetical protein
MQLPRGTFQGIKKDIGWADLLEELQGMRFTGSVNFEVDRKVVNLVFRRGKMILSEFGSEKGDAALGCMTGLGDRNVDASLSEMTEPQLSLALEFNPESRIQSSSRSPRAATEENAINIQPARTEKPREIPRESIASETKLPVPPVPPVPLVPPVSSTGPSEVISLVEAIERGHAGGEPEKPAPIQMAGPPGERYSNQNTVADLEETEDDASMARDLRALDEMDLDGMSDKIRSNCRFIVERLNLGHLIENETTNEK